MQRMFVFVTKVDERVNTLTYLYSKFQVRVSSYAQQKSWEHGETAGLMLSKNKNAGLHATSKITFRLT